ncbi:hypothetical protein HDV01_001912 [Terramyces sp. JEL0728]|nr:hypothetical protein HDV01_001912 [Terramyces sp. JEL0728]
MEKSVMKQVYVSLVVVVFTSVVIGLRYSILSLWGYPRSITAKSQIDGDNVSGQYAWDFLHQMINKTHTYASQENLKVRQLIIDEINSIQDMRKSMNCSAEFQLEFDATNMSYGVTYFESNNVLVRVKGQSSDALLVSAHFDSVDFSLGVTDDGIGIGSMISSLYSLAKKTCTSPLQADIIFNFNNGEELGLYGGMAFSLHPWFKDVKGFINLEGTGGAGYERSLLFRTNHYSLNYRLMHSTPFVHASIMAQEIVGKFSGSITDWQIYGENGVPGSDYAFYTNRYVYHSTKDDFDHASVYSTQYMADNLYAGILSVANDRAFLSSIGNEGNSGSATPGFFFHDVVGVIAIMYSKTVFFIFSSIVVGVLIGILFTTGFIQGKDMKTWAFYKPYLFGVLYTMLFWVLSFGSVALLSMARNTINKGSTYGMSLLSYFSSVFLVFAIAFGMNYVVDRFFVAKYNLLPGSVESGLDKESTDDEEIDRKEQISDYLFASNLIFWALVTLLAIVATAQKLMVAYFLFDWTYYYAAGYVLSTFKPVQKFRWITILAVSSSIPFLISVDLTHMFITFFPSSLVEGLPSYIVDVFFMAPLLLYMTNVIPVIAKLQTLYPAIASFMVFLALWICGCCIFPYSSEQPVHITPLQFWDITTNTTANDGYIEYQLSILGFPAIMDPHTWSSKAGDSLPPKFQLTSFYNNQHVLFNTTKYPLGLDNTADVTALIQANVQTLTLNGRNGWQVDITGPPAARYCQVSSDDRVEPTINICAKKGITFKDGGYSCFRRNQFELEIDIESHSPVLLYNSTPVSHYVVHVTCTNVLNCNKVFILQKSKVDEPVQPVCVPADSKCNFTIPRLQFNRCTPINKNSNRSDVYFQLQVRVSVVCCDNTIHDFAIFTSENLTVFSGTPSKYLVAKRKENIQKSPSYHRKIERFRSPTQMNMALDIPYAKSAQNTPIGLNTIFDITVPNQQSKFKSEIQNRPTVMSADLILQDFISDFELSIEIKAASKVYLHNQPGSQYQIHVSCSNILDCNKLQVKQKTKGGIENVHPVYMPVESTSTVTIPKLLFNRCTPLNKHRNLSDAYFQLIVTVTIVCANNSVYHLATLTSENLNVLSGTPAKYTIGKLDRQFKRQSEKPNLNYSAVDWNFNLDRLGDQFAGKGPNPEHPADVQPLNFIPGTTDVSLDVFLLDLFPEILIS